MGVSNAVNDDRPAHDDDDVVVVGVVSPSPSVPSSTPIKSVRPTTSEKGVVPRVVVSDRPAAVVVSSDPPPPPVEKDDDDDDETNSKVAAAAAAASDPAAAAPGLTAASSPGSTVPSSSSSTTTMTSSTEAGERSEEEAEAAASSSGAAAADTKGGDEGKGGDDDDDDDDGSYDDEGSVASSASSAADSSSASSSGGSGGSASTLLSDSSSSSTRSSILASDDDDDDDSVSDASSRDGDDDDDGGGGESIALLEARMLRNFAVRDRVLKRIGKGKDPEYVKFLRENEEAVRREARSMLEQRKKAEARREEGGGDAEGQPSSDGRGDIHRSGATEKDDDGSDGERRSGGPLGLLLLLPSAVLGVGRSSEAGIETPPTSPREGEATPPPPRQRSPLAESIHHESRFHLYHVLPGLSTLVLYCVAHLSVYELVNAVVLHVASRFPERESLVHGAVLLASFALTRVTGGIWDWLDNDRYRCVKFDMHNRLRLRSVDARVLRWFRRRVALKCALDVLAMYLCFVAVGHFLNQGLLRTLCDSRGSLLAGLPSRNLGGKEEDGGDEETYWDYLLHEDDLKDYLAEEHFGESSCPASSSSSDDNVLLRLRRHIAGAVASSSEPWWNETLAEMDEAYLKSRLSTQSYEAFAGDPSAVLVSASCSFVFSACCAALSIGLLYRNGVQFWDI